MSTRKVKPVVKSKAVKAPRYRKKTTRPAKADAASVVRAEKVQGGAVASPNESTAITIKCALSSDAIRDMILSLWSKVFSKPWSAPSVIGTDFDSIGTAYVYIQNLFATITSANRPNIVTLPRWLHVVLNLLRPHSPNFRVNTLKYQWQDSYVVDVSCVPSVNIAGRNYTFLIGYPDPNQTSGYNQPMTAASPDVNAETDGTAFQAFMGLFRDGNNPDTNLVAWDSILVGLNDPSAFSRSFSYLGSSGLTPGNTYGSCELETSFLKSWIPAQFCPYQDVDVRVSRSFHSRSGDSSLLMTLPFLPNQQMSDYRNPAPVIYKYIDFEEVYAWVITWLRASLFQVMSNNATTNTISAPLMMSSQTFRIVLRQALLQIFTEQATVQFMTQRPAASASDNVFVPFILNSGSYSSVNFANLKLPQILIENLRMLKTHVTHGPKGSRAKLVRLPVLGRWWNDEFDVDPNLATGTEWPIEERNDKIFAILPSLEVGIDLIDASTTNTIINLNSEYYQTAVNMINDYFSGLIAAGGSLSTCGGDTGPGLSLLHVTKYVSTFPANHVVGEPFSIMRDHVTSLTRTKSKEKLPPVSPSKIVVNRTPSVTTSPVGGVANDFVSSVSSSVSLSQPLQLLVTRLILPVIRASVQPPFAQQESEWQIAYIEPYRVDCASGSLSNGSTCSVAASIAAAAKAPITSTSSGASSDELVELMNQLALTGKSVNWGALLSGAIQVGSMVANVVSSVI